MWVVFGFLKFTSWGKLGKFSESGFFFWKTKIVILISKPVGLPMSWFKESGT